MRGQIEWVARWTPRPARSARQWMGGGQPDHPDWPVHPNCRVDIVSPFGNKEEREVNVQEIRTFVTYKGKTLER